MAMLRGVASAFLWLVLLASAVSILCYLVCTSCVFKFNSEIQLDVGHSTQVNIFHKEYEEQHTRSKVLHGDVVFLKTHKTASSTFQNILFRFGEKNNLTFAFPIQGHQFYYPQDFMASYVAMPPRAVGGRFHMLCSHMRFHMAEVARVMSDNATFLSIVRSPDTHFESVFHYYENNDPAFIAAKNHSDRVNKGPFRTFLESAETFYKRNRKRGPFGRNPMAFDFGLNPNADVSSREFRSGLAQLDVAFDLVMITERFDESVILAKEILGWAMEDVVYLSNNKRAKIHNDKPLEREDTRLTEMIRRWNALDVALYEHFSRRFQRQVEAFGVGRMRREVDALRREVSARREECVASEVGVHEIKEMEMMPYAPESVDILGFNMKSGLEPRTRERCLRLLLPEPHYHARLFRTQRRSWMEKLRYGRIINAGSVAMLSRSPTFALSSIHD
ncbi:galactose-3-O-sulfotransferase 2-like [Petromyzon marinus]|uniref:galactose-3-O-sulfotransferase 2-like n=1 Tax=Petromyzon marinus TaxID=7757 RepID=UPI003F72B5BD